MWEQELADLLNDLSEVQQQTLEVLAEKRQCLVRSDLAGMAALQEREVAVIERLQQCHDRRSTLLARAADEGLPAKSIRQLAGALPGGAHPDLCKQMDEAQSRARLLQHQSFTNWVAVQRTLIHLSQLLEIIATGGRLQPTYGSDASASTAGALVDRAA